MNGCCGDHYSEFTTIDRLTQCRISDSTPLLFYVPFWNVGSGSGDSDGSYGVSSSNSDGGKGGGKGVGNGGGNGGGNCGGSSSCALKC